MQQLTACLPRGDCGCLLCCESSGSNSHRLRSECTHERELRYCNARARTWLPGPVRGRCCCPHSHANQRRMSLGNVARRKQGQFSWRREGSCSRNTPPWAYDLPHRLVGAPVRRAADPTQPRAQLPIRLKAAADIARVESSKSSRLRAKHDARNERLVEKAAESRPPWERAPPLVRLGVPRIVVVHQRAGA